jgi:hypothetical protein
MARALSVCRRAPDDVFEVDDQVHLARGRVVVTFSRARADAIDTPTTMTADEVSRGQAGVHLRRL